MHKFQKKDRKLKPDAFPYRGSVTRDRFKWEELKALIVEFKTIKRVAEVLNVPYNHVYSYIRYDSECLKWWKAFKKDTRAAHVRSYDREKHARKSSLTKEEIYLIHTTALESARTTKLEEKMRRRRELIEALEESDPQAAKALRDLEGAEIA